jgi:hypothetical protein
VSCPDFPHWTNGRTIRTAEAGSRYRRRLPPAYSTLHTSFDLAETYLLGDRAGSSRPDQHRPNIGKP